MQYARINNVFGDDKKAQMIACINTADNANNNEGGLKYGKRIFV